MKEIAAALALALLAGGSDRSEEAPPKINMVAVIPSPPDPPTEEYRLPPNPDCTPGREGEYRGHGNRWQRDGHICIDQVEVSFLADPEPGSLGYSVTADRCPDLGHFSRFRMPEKLFEMPVPEQIGLLKRALADDLREFGRRCGMELDPAPFVDERFDRFYADFGDGWWFDRLDGEFRLTPNITERGAETATR